MKEKFELIRENFLNQDKKTSLYFGFYFLFFIVLFGVLLVSSTRFSCDDIQQNCEESEPYIEKNKNYGFRYEISIGNENIILSGSRYNNEFLIDKRVEGLLTKYYIYYYDIFKLNHDNKWIKYDGEIIENFDRKLINIDYLEEILEDAELTRQTDNKVTFVNYEEDIKLESFFDDDFELEYMQLTKDDLSIKYNYFDHNLIKKFNIDISQ